MGNAQNSKAARGGRSGKYHWGDILQTTYTVTRPKTEHSPPRFQVGDEVP